MYIKVTGNDNYNCIELKTFYDKGGSNYFTGSVDARGYYVSCRPMHISQGVQSFTLFAGYKRFVKPCGRYNKSTMTKLESQTLENGKDLVYKVAEEFGLTLEETPEQAMARSVA